MDYLDSTKRVTLADIIENEDSREPHMFEYTVKAPEQSDHENRREMTTVIDRVYDYINKKNTTTVHELSEHLGIKKQQVEKMIEMLETSQLIKVRYSVVPNGKIEVLIAKKEQKEVEEISHEEKIKGLRKVIEHDIERLEHSMSSIEHHLKMWALEVEEKSSKSNMKQENLARTNQESIRIENNLEQVQCALNTKISSLKKRLSDMRMNINGLKESKSLELPRKEHSGSGFFGIKYPFNF